MMKKRDKLAFISLVLFIILIISTLFNVYLILTKGDETPIKQRSELSIEEIREHIDRSLDERFIGEDKIRGIIEEYTNTENEPPEVIHGKDGKDGSPGKDGADGKDGKDGINGKDAPTPIIRCNQELDRLEVKYLLEDAWEIMDGETINCIVGGYE